MERRKFLKGRFTALLLALCMVAVLLPTTVFAAGTITVVQLNNTRIPAEITADMKITTDMQSANCSTTGCSVTAAEWNVTSPGGGEITPDTTLNAGDTICLTLTITANDGYEFAKKNEITDPFLFAEFDGTVTFNGKTVNSDYVTLWDMSNPSDGKYEMTVGIEYTVAQGGGEQPAQSNRFEVALDDVAANGTLSAELGMVKYCLISNGEIEGNFVSLGEDFDGTADGVTMTIDNTGGNQPRVKYSYNVTDTSKRFELRIAPAEGKTATVQSDNAGQMSTVGSCTVPTTFVVPAGAFYRISFRDIGSQPGGGDGPMPDENGSDAAAPENAIKVQFFDRNGNSRYYDAFHADTTVGVMGTVQYSYNNTDWYEFSKERVNTDSDLYWNTQGEAENKVHTYYFSQSVSNVNLKLIAGDVSCDVLNGKLTNGTAYSLTAGTTYTLKHDDGVKNITWSDDAQEADQRVEHGRVIIESAVIGDENTLISGGQFSQQGNKGYLGIKGGATVTVKLIPDYGYQVGTLELNGQRLTPQDEESTYTFTMPDCNLHLRAIFEESDDEINATADGVNGGSITGGEKVIDSGNLRLSVINSTMTDAQKTAMKDSAAAKNTDILSYLEVDLEKFVNKGNSGEEWTEGLEELTNKVKITLNVGTDLDASKTYVVVREHNGVYQQIPAVYDKTYGTLTFESDKFSDYALATIESGSISHTHNGTLHKGFTATCTVNGEKDYYTCFCGKYFEDADCTKEISNINGWKAIKAIGHKDENKDYKCDVCDAAVGTKPTETTNPGITDNYEKSPQTGDNSNMALWFVLLTTSGVGVLGTTLYSKKRRQAK